MLFTSCAVVAASERGSRKPRGVPWQHRGHRAAWAALGGVSGGHLSGHHEAQRARRHHILIIFLSSFYHLFASFEVIFTSFSCVSVAFRGSGRAASLARPRRLCRRWSTASPALSSTYFAKSDQSRKLSRSNLDGENKEKKKRETKRFQEISSGLMFFLVYICVFNGFLERFLEIWRTLERPVARTSRPSS